MKKIIIRLMAMNILLIFTTSVLAGGALSPNVVKTVAFQSGGFFMYADGWPNPNSCTNSNGVVLLNSDTNYDKAYALLLSAYMSGKRISGYSDGCATFDGKTYNTIRGFKYLVVRE